MNRYIDDLKCCDYLYKVDNTEVEQWIGFKADPLKRYNMSTKSDGINLCVYGNNYKGDENYFEINLGISWVYIFAFISECYIGHGKNRDKTLSNIWTFDKRERGKNIRYTLSIIREPSKKQLYIKVERFDKFEKKNKKTIVYKLSKNDVYQLLYIVIELISRRDDFSFLLKKSERSNLYLQKTNKKETENFIGDKNTIKKYSVISKRDEYLLFLSAENRILFGKWIDFQGDLVTISYEGIFTNVIEEFDLEDDEHFAGSLAAIVFIANYTRDDL